MFLLRFNSIMREFHSIPRIQLTVILDKDWFFSSFLSNAIYARAYVPQNPRLKVNALAYTINARTLFFSECIMIKSRLTFEQN